MRSAIELRSLYIAGFLFLAANLWFLFREEVVLNAVPFVFIAIYAALYHLDKVFLCVVFCTPLSVNIEEYVGGSVGLFLPTEPLLFGILLVVIFNQMRHNYFDTAFIRHPVTIIFIALLDFFDKYCERIAPGIT
jgi:putative inorganic carbon (hco3(-)) transporter